MTIHRLSAALIVASFIIGVAAAATELTSNSMALLIGAIGVGIGSVVNMWDCNASFRQDYPAHPNNPPEEKP